MKKSIAIIFVGILFIGSVFANTIDDEKIIRDNSISTSTSIEGVILDKNTNEALAGVKITLTGMDNEVYTDLEGNFEFKNLPKSSYTIESEMISYKKKSVEVGQESDKQVVILLENN